jgi:hypothetical protein
MTSRARRAVPWATSSARRYSAKPRSMRSHPDRRCVIFSRIKPMRARRRSRPKSWINITRPRINPVRAMCRRNSSAERSTSTSRAICRSWRRRFSSSGERKRAVRIPRATRPNSCASRATAARSSFPNRPGFRMKNGRTMSQSRSKRSSRSATGRARKEIETANPCRRSSCPISSRATTCAASTAAN